MKKAVALRRIKRISRNQALRTIQRRKLNLIHSFLQRSVPLPLLRCLSPLPSVVELSANTGVTEVAYATRNTGI